MVVGFDGYLLNYPPMFPLLKEVVLDGTHLAVSETLSLNIFVQ